MPPPPRALILDLGNVLVWHDNALLFRRLAERAGKAPDAVAATLLGPGWHQANRGALDAEGIHRMVCGALGVELTPDEFAALWSCHFTLHDAVLPIVEGLAGRVQLALLSNTNAAHVAWLRPRLPLLSRFDQLLFSNEVGMVKPDPEFYREALRRLGVSPAEAAFFDDVPEYVEAARALGIRAEVFQDAPTFVRQLEALGLEVRR